MMGLSHRGLRLSLTGLQLAAFATLLRSVALDRWITVAVSVALLIAALASPLVVWGQRLGIPKKLAALLVVIIGIGFIALLVTFVGNQVASGVGDLSKQVTDGIDQIRDWLRTGPLHITCSSSA